MNSLNRILLVDNNTETQGAVMAALENEGYIVKVVSKHNAAIEMSRTFKPHLFIISLKMPDGSGFKLLEKLKMAEGTFKVIFISANESVDDIQKAYRLGAIGYLTQPIKHKDVVEQVRYGIECVKDQEEIGRHKKKLEKEVSERTADISKALEIAEYQSRQIDLLFNCMSEPLVAVDFENKIMRLNVASEKYLGLKPCDCLGMNFSDYIKDQNLNCTISSILNHFNATGEAVAKSPVVSKVNERIYSVSINIMNDLTERPSGCVLLFSDQTELYRSSQLRSGFLTLVAHEFRTPLTALLNGLDILKNRQIEQFVFTDVLDMMNLSINRFSRLINNLLTFASVQDTNAVPVITTFSYVSLVDNLKDALYSSAIEKNIELVHTFDSDFNAVTTDEQLLRYSLESIIDNAIKFSPIESNVHIRSTLVHSSNQHLLKITIKDAGPGIPQAKLKTLFEWFTQDDDRLSRNYQGVGIGLPLSLRAIEILNGSLDYAQNEDAGSCFVLTVPVKLVE
ncbi:MAG TPA: response regulator [Chitinispirillaceae bacterium]|nr:response regulator [Chitinispirillaceae bacterium]